MEDGLSDEEAINAYIEYMVDEGVILLDGITDDGEAIYKVDMDKAELLAPEFAAAHLLETEDTVIDLYEKGLVDMTISDKGEVFYKAVPQDE